ILVVAVLYGVCIVVPDLNDSRLVVVFKTDPSAMGRPNLLKISLAISIQSQLVHRCVYKIEGRALRHVRRVIRFGEMHLGSIRQTQSPSIAIPCDERLVKWR